MCSPPCFWESYDRSYGRVRMCSPPCFWESYDCSIGSFTAAVSSWYTTVYTTVAVMDASFVRYKVLMAWSHREEPYGLC
ncbi:hypothetical protein DY000_02062365 [Brassica cretica]|uniref:Uncharacterized protein n=1 Tax=Brassica cretica TaxID=69181 RepID=A0ABQ7B256_BRACR|nr:hypothetical protein DY000_02062365 [Brassica cretica]